MLSQELLLDALDSEALYTMVGGIKPISEGFFGTYFPVVPPGTSELERVREALSVWRCGECFESGVLVFEQLRRDQRFASAWIGNRHALNEKIESTAMYFGRLGLSKHARAESVLLSIERATDASERWRGFGLVFGYPKDAIDFFVRAGEHHAETGEFVRRDFRSYPTVESDSSSFVYAVPRLQIETDEERRLRRRVQSILTVYRGMRDQYITDESPAKIEQLVRDWFDDGTGWCHPDHALQKAQMWDEARTWVEESAIELTTVDPSSENLRDLESLDGVLSGRRIIGMGESTHGTRDFFQLKHRVFRHLVENHDFKLFGIEASFAACVPINDYVLTGKGDPRKAIKGQGFWTWDTEEVLELVQWMRRWNQRRPSEKSPLRFYGFDTQDAFTPLKMVLADSESRFPQKTVEWRKQLSLALDEQYGKALGKATAGQLDDLLVAVRGMQSFYEANENATESQLTKRVSLLFRQALAAIQIHRARIDQWSSIGMLKEIELYSRIRENRVRLETWASEQKGRRAAVFAELIKCAEDLAGCQRQFRTGLSPSERTAWRESVEWALKMVGDDETRVAIAEMQQFLEVSTEYLNKPTELANVRDETMAEFVGEILRQHGEDSRIMLWAHDWHISKIGGDQTTNMPRMGTYLEQEFGPDYVPVGLSFGTGDFQAIYQPGQGEDPAKGVLREFSVEGSRYDSFSHLFDYCDRPLIAFSLSGESSESLPRWMRLPQQSRSIGAVFHSSMSKSEVCYEEITLDQHYEMVIHIREASRAKPLSPASRFRFGARLEEQRDAHESVTAIESDHPVVSFVASQSLAAKSGLRVGDRIVAFDGHVIHTSEEFESVLAGVERPGSHPIEVLRQADEKSASETLTFYVIVPPWAFE
ncbi:MAG: erythromycin esterase family protein [Planctomycetota bacterium]